MPALAEVKREQRHPNTRGCHHGKYKGKWEHDDSTKEGSHGGWEASGEAEAGRKESEPLQGSGNATPNMPLWPMDYFKL